MNDAQKPPGAPSADTPQGPGPRTLEAATIDLPALAARAPQAEADGSGSAAARQDPYVGTTIEGRYVVDRVLGEGGMGVVYAGRHQMIDKRVAIKVLRRDMAADSEVCERFLQEARAASAVGNPHIVDISDFGRMPDGATYLVMELLDGKSLGRVLAESGGPLPVPRLCHVGKQIARGLAAAHAASIVHRDLKPDNVMLVQRGGERDFVKILDFGIAKVGTGTKKMTRAGSVIGTPHYMSPEQAAGAPVDARTDVYALGVILYEMASGKVPFDADNFMGILTQHMYKQPVALGALTPATEVSPALDAIILKCLTKNPDGRYPSMDALLADIEKLEHGESPDALADMASRTAQLALPPGYFDPPRPLPASAGRSAGTRKSAARGMLAVAIVGGVLAAVTVVAWIAKGSSRREPAASVASVAVAAPPSSAARTVPEPAATLAPVVEAPPHEATHEVLVSVVPSDATIVRDGRPLGESPVALEVAPGQKVELVLERKGYKTKTVTVGDDAPKQVFSLEPNAAPSRPRPAAPAGRGIDDVGDPFATPSH